MFASLSACLARVALLCCWVYGHRACCCSLSHLQRCLPGTGTEFLLSHVWTLCSAHPRPHVSKATCINLTMPFFTTETVYCLIHWVLLVAAHAQNMTRPGGFLYNTHRSSFTRPPFSPAQHSPDYPLLPHAQVQEAVPEAQGQLQHVTCGIT